VAGRDLGAAESAAKGRALTATGFSMCGFSVTGFPDGGQADAPERSAAGFQDDGFCAVHRD